MCCSGLGRTGSWRWAGPEAAQVQIRSCFPIHRLLPSSKAGNLAENPHLSYPSGHLRLLIWWLAWNCAEAQMTTNWEAGGANLALSADLAIQTAISSREVWFYNDPERFVRAHLHSHSYRPVNQHYRHNLYMAEKKKNPTSKKPEQWLNASRISTYFLCREILVSNDKGNSLKAIQELNAPF